VRTRRGPVTAAVAALVAVALATTGVTGGAPQVAPVSSVAVQPATPVTDPIPAHLPGNRPNVVVVMADDMRADDVRWMPNLRRRVGRAGVRFANSFSPHPLCCPARASFVTGQYTHNHGVWSNSTNFGFAALDDTHTVATELAAVGYRTAFLGKYLNGYGRMPAPDGSAESSLGYVPPGWTDWRGTIDAPPGWNGPDLGSTYRYRDTTLNVNGVLRGNPGIYQTRLLGHETSDVIAEAARSPEPFFLWASYVAPHVGMPREGDDPGDVVRADGTVEPVRTPARPNYVRGMFDDRISRPPGAAGDPDMSDTPYFMRERLPLTSTEMEAVLELTRQRAEALAVLDEEVADTIDALEAAGELDDTIVVFTSDNGFLLGEHRIRLGKNFAYEDSLRVPLLMRGPGIPAGEVRRDPVTTVDLAPTFLDAAGARPDPRMDGASVLDVARDGDRGWDHGVFFESGPRAVPSEEEVPAGVLDVRPEGPSPLRFSQGVRTARYLYVEHASRERELYDLRRDPDQLTNVVDQPGRSALVGRLASYLDLLRVCRGPAECAPPLAEDLRRP
jgi:N-acetylglucosamine-6-sulfatase